MEPCVIRVFRKTPLGAIAGEPVVAKDYKRSSRQVHGEPYPIIVSHTGGRVRGLLLLVTQEELAHGDRYEDTIYTRKKIPLVGGLSAWAYVYEKSR